MTYQHNCHALCTNLKCTHKPEKFIPMQCTRQVYMINVSNFFISVCFTGIFGVRFSNKNTLDWTQLLINILKKLVVCDSTWLMQKKLNRGRELLNVHLSIT